MKPAKGLVKRIIFMIGVGFVTPFVTWGLIGPSLDIAPPDPTDIAVRYVPNPEAATPRSIFIDHRSRATTPYCGSIDKPCSSIPSALLTVGTSNGSSWSNTLVPFNSVAQGFMCQANAMCTVDGQPIGSIVMTSTASGGTGMIPTSSTINFPATQILVGSGK